MKEFVKYAIKRQNDGTFTILQKDLISKKLTIHSNHDTYNEAKDELNDIHAKPSQEELLFYFGDLKERMKNI